MGSPPFQYLLLVNREYPRGLAKKQKHLEGEINLLLFLVKPNSSCCLSQKPPVGAGQQQLWGSAPGLLETAVAVGGFLLPAL